MVSKLGSSSLLRPEMHGKRAELPVLDVTLEHNVVVVCTYGWSLRGGSTVSPLERR